MASVVNLKFLTVVIYLATTRSLTYVLGDVADESSSSDSNKDISTREELRQKLEHLKVR